MLYAGSSVVLRGLAEHTASLVTICPVISGRRKPRGSISAGEHPSTVQQDLQAGSSQIFPVIVEQQVLVGGLCSGARVRN